MDQQPPDHVLRDRLLAACAYVGPGFLAPALLATHSEFLRWHTAQGFVLFFLEAVALAFLVFLDATIGRIPLLGLLVMLVARIALVVAFLVVSIVGIVKALAGERVELPWIEQYARRIPGAVEHPDSQN